MNILKKIVLFIVLFLILGFVIFIAPAFLKPKISSESHVTIQAPASEVWSKFMDQNNMGKWLANFKRIERISGEPGSIGSKYSVVLEMNGEEQIAVETITAITPEKTFAFNLESDIFIDEITMTFNPDGDSTQIIQAETASGKGAIWRALMFWISGQMQGISQQNLNNLKAFIEESN